MLAIECLKAILYGIVEGVTEWLPVSSTGHLILLQEWLPFSFSEDTVLLEEFFETFEVVVQLGAILAVVRCFWSRLVPQRGEARAVCGLWGRIFVAGIPAAFVGILGDALLVRLTGRDIDELLYTPLVVALALVVYGILFIVVERQRGGPSVPALPVETEISFKKAFWIGLFQCLAIVPGTSRSGATILGASLVGVSRPGAAEFSFFLAVPVMIGASGIKLCGFFAYLLQGEVALPPVAWVLLAVGTLTAYLVSLVTIRFLTDFVKRHSFLPFGIYRILLGGAVLLAFF